MPLKTLATCALCHNINNIKHSRTRKPERLGFSRSSRPFLSNTDKKLSSNDSFCLCLYLPILTFERQNKQALKTAMSLSNIDTWEEIFVTWPLRHLIDFHFQVRYFVKQAGKCTARYLSTNRRRKVRTGRTDQVYAMALAASEARHKRLPSLGNGQFWV